MPQNSGLSSSRRQAERIRQTRKKILPVHGLERISDVQYKVEVIRAKIIETPMTPHSIKIRITHPHRHVKSQDDHLEIHADTKTGIHSQLVVETVEMELAVRQQLIGMVIPDVAGIHKESSVH